MDVVADLTGYAPVVCAAMAFEQEAPRNVRLTRLLPVAARLHAVESMQACMCG
jgi:hypothetical protein